MSRREIISSKCATKQYDIMYKWSKYILIYIAQIHAMYIIYDNYQLVSLQVSQKLTLSISSLCFYRVQE
ncbi:hypothetical protein SEA27A368_39890 [Salmonella enterica]|nr:hypothetical protein SEA27A368_39890 [Salmonella enterica]